MHPRLCLSYALVASVLMAASAEVNAGRIVVANDEWTLSNTGFASAGVSTTNFVNNVANWFTGGGAGNFLAYSNNFGFNQTSLATSMANAGHTYTVSTAVTFDLPTLSTFDAVFVGGFAADNTVLTDYVNNGGHVYLAGGTGSFGSAVAEANAWNPFLGNFSMEFANVFNNIGGNIAISSAHPIFNNVSQLFQNNGSSIINVTGPDAQVLISSGGMGLYAVFDAVAVIPLPTPLGMGLAGLGLVALGRRRR